MTDRGVLAAISERCDAEIRFFDLVQLRYTNRTRKAFLCVGKHGIFVLIRPRLVLVNESELHFEIIDKFVEDADNESDIVVVLTKNRPPLWTGDQLWIRTFQRDLLLKYIQVAWCTDRMYRYGRVALFPRYRNTFSESVWEEKSMLQSCRKVHPFLEFQEMSYGGYTFFLADSFKDRATATATEDTGNYIDARGFEVTIHIHEALPVVSLPEIGQESIKATAAQYRRTLTERSRHYDMMIDDYYNKKMNLTDDPCSWTGWQILCATPEAYTMVILLRRNYSSALMDLSQDLAVVFRITTADMRENDLQHYHVVHECCIAADSLGPDTRIHSCYRDLIQYKLDALLFDEDSYTWLQYRLKVQPSILPKCKSFVKTLLKLIDSAGCLRDKELIFEIGEKVPVEENPITVLNWIVRNGEGFDLYDIKSPEQLRLQHRWQQRVARYLAFLLDGNLLAGKFKLADLASVVGALGPDGDQIVRQILEFLLHVRSRDWTEPFAGSFLSKVTARTPTASIIYNDAAMEALLECGYVGRLFPHDNEEGYIRFISLLLRSPSSSSALKLSIFRQILQAASGSSATTQAFLGKQQQNFLMGVVPSLVYLLKATAKSPLAPIDTMTGSPFLTSLAVVVLVTLSAGNMAVKALLLNAGIARVVVSQIRVADGELRQYCVKLSINLTKTSLQRQRFISAGLLPTLADILIEEYNSPQQQTVQLVYEIAALIGQLANEPTARTELLTRYPVLDCLFYLFHNSIPHSVGRSRIIFAIRQLGCQNWQTRQRVGLHVLGTILQDIRNVKMLLASPSPVDYAKQCLSLLLTVALYKPYCANLQDSDIQAIIKELVESLNVSSIVDKAQQLEVRVAKNVRYR